MTVKNIIMHYFDSIDPASVKALGIATVLWIFGDYWPSNMADAVKLLSGLVFIAYNAHRWYVFHIEQKNKSKEK